MDFGEKLHKMRKEKKMSQEQLAEKLNVTRQAVSKWESGAIPDVDNIVKISAFFDCSLDYLMSNKEEEKEEDITVIENNEKTMKVSKMSWDIKWLLACVIPIGVLLALWTLANYSDTELHIKDASTGMMLTKFLTYVLDYNLYIYVYGSIICLYVFVTIKCLYPIIDKKEKNKKYRIIMWLVYMLGVMAIHNDLLNPNFSFYWSMWFVLFLILYFLVLLFLEMKVSNSDKIIC